MLGSMAFDTHIEPNHKLWDVPEDGAIDKESYERLVGRLIYLSHTWPDIAYAMSVANQLMHNPKETHLKVVHMILHDLK